MSNPGKKSKNIISSAKKLLFELYSKIIDNEKKIEIKLAPELPKNILPLMLKKNKSDKIITKLKYIKLWFLKNSKRDQ